MNLFYDDGKVFVVRPKKNSTSVSALVVEKNIAHSSGPNLFFVLSVCVPKALIRLYFALVVLFGK